MVLIPETVIQPGLTGGPLPHAPAIPPARSAFDLVVTRLKDVRPTAKGVRAQCPAHDDSTPSLDVDQGDDGRVLLQCRSARCSFEAIVAALGLTPADLNPRSQGSTRGPKLSSRREPKVHDSIEGAIRAAAWSINQGKKNPGQCKCTCYDYTDGEGNVLGGVLRFNFEDGRPKEIRRFSRKGNGWVLKDMDTPRPLYRLHDLVRVEADGIVIFVEGEKCVQAVFALGMVATTSAGGANQHLDKTDFSPLAARQVVILPDNDRPGQQYADCVAAKAREAGAACVRLLHLPQLGPGEDVVDWAEALRKAGADQAHVANELRRLVDSAPDAPASQDPDTDLGRPELGAKEGHIRLGDVDPGSGKLVLSPRKTLPTAHAFLRLFYQRGELRTLFDFSGVLWQWRGNRYVEIEDRDLAGQMQRWLHQALRYHFNKATRQLELVDFDSNPTTVSAAITTVRAEAFLSKDTEVPSWLGGAADQPPANELLVCKSMTLHVPTQNVLPPTPTLFVQNALTFDYAPDAPEPLKWIAFLRQLWGDDAESLRLLQEWFGYCLIADTRYQKMLLLVGPRRSGKGTIARVLRELVGRGNVAGPTTGSLTGPFGLQPLLGKTLAIVSDARFSGDHVPTLVERLLVISGEDAVTVDRKHLTSVTLRLPIRFTFLTNELPRFTDASTALAGRFMVLALSKSFYGNEDPYLTDDLLQELPGILLWAIEGWLRLHDRGRFDEPASSRMAIEDIEDLSSPVHAFVRDRCLVGPGHRVPVDALYDAWKAWCTADGRTGCTTKQTFGRDLAAAAPGVKPRRGSQLVRFYDGIGLKPAEAPE